MQNPDTHNQNEESSTFNPFSWGILFFGFWCALKVTEQLTGLQEGISLVALIFSIILLLSIYIPPIREFLNSHKVRNILLPSVFNITVFLYILSWVTSLPSMQGGYMIVALVVGFLWLVTLIIVLVITIPNLIVRVASSLVFFIPGIIYLIRHLFYEGSYLVILGIILLFVAIKRPRWIYNRFPLF